MSRHTIMRGSAVDLEGPELKPGDKAPDFTVVDTSMQPVSLASTGNHTRIFSVVPSLDTPVCDQQTRRFNEEAAKLDGIDIYTVSVDLPFAQKRWCGAAGIDKVKVVSDHRDVSFGKAYGTCIPNLRILSRAIFVVDPSNTIRYVEYVPEVGQHPDYDKALAAAKETAQS